MHLPPQQGLPCVQHACCDALGESGQHPRQHMRPTQPQPGGNLLSGMQRKQLPPGPHALAVPPLHRGQPWRHGCVGGGVRLHRWCRAHPSAVRRQPGQRVCRCPPALTSLLVCRTWRPWRAPESQQVQARVIVGPRACIRLWSAICPHLSRLSSWSLCAACPHMLGSCGDPALLAGCTAAGGGLPALCSQAMNRDWGLSLELSRRHSGRPGRIYRGCSRVCAAGGTRGAGLAGC